MMSEENWVEVRVRKVTAVVKCLICGKLNKNVDYGDLRITGKVLLHCNGCNTNRQHVVVERIMEVIGMVDLVTEEAVIDMKTSEDPEGPDSPNSEEPEG